jgi:hypothetical protein
MRSTKSIYIHDELKAIISSANELAMWRSCKRNIADPTVWKIEGTSILFFLYIFQLIYD